MLLDDRIGHGQTEPRAFTDLLGREKRIEDPGLHFLWHAGTIVVHFEDDGVRVEVVPGAQDQRSTTVRVEHRLLRIDDQVQQHLLHLVRIREDERQPSGERLEDVDVAQTLLVRAQRQRFAHHLVHIHHRTRGVSLARKREQIANDLGSPLRFAQDRFETAFGLIVDVPLRQALCPGENRREGIVQFVGDARNRLAESGQLFGLQ